MDYRIEKLGAEPHTVARIAVVSEVLEAPDWDTDWEMGLVEVEQETDLTDLVHIAAAAALGLRAHQDMEVVKGSADLDRLETVGLAEALGSDMVVVVGLLVVRHMLRLLHLQPKLRPFY